MNSEMAHRSIDNNNNNSSEQANKQINKPTNQPTEAPFFSCEEFYFYARIIMRLQVCLL